MRKSQENMITDYEADQGRNWQERLVSEINGHDGRLNSQAMELGEMKEDFRVAGFISCINYLCSIGELTSLEARSIHDMMSSSDSENHFMARMVLTKKLEKINYTGLRLNIMGLNFDDKAIVSTYGNDPNFFKI